MDRIDVIKKRLEKMELSRKGIHIVTYYGGEKEKSRAIEKYKLDNKLSGDNSFIAIRIIESRVDLKQNRC